MPNYRFRGKLKPGLMVLAQKNSSQSVDLFGK
jgi:hypothetical protein